MRQPILPVQGSSVALAGRLQWLQVGGLNGLVPEPVVVELDLVPGSRGTEAAQPDGEARTRNRRQLLVTNGSGQCATCAAAAAGAVGAGPSVPAAAL